MNYVTIKLWEETRRLLRLLAADSGEQMVEIMHRLCEEEWERVKPKDPKTEVKTST
jgi:hypothetical protein